MKKYSQFPALFGLFFLVILFLPDIAHALPKGGETPEGTLGAVIVNTIKSSNNIPGLLTGLSYLAGILFGAWGIFKLREHVEAPQQVPIWDPVKRFFAGGAFLSLPMLIEAVQDTVAEGLDPVSTSKFSTGGVSGGGLDAMMVSLMTNLWAPMHYLIVSFSYLAGIILVMIGISRFLKSEQEGARGPTGIGTIMTFLVAGALFSMDKMVAAISKSLFDSTQIKVTADLVYKEGLNGTEPHIEAVISAVVAFVMLLGWISIVRGFFIIRGVSEGNSQASIMAGMTHLLGGGLAVNLGPVINAVQETLGIDKYGITFG